MTSSQEFLLSDARRELRRTLASITNYPALDQTFVGWLLTTDADLEIDLKRIVGEVAEHSGASRSYQDVAILGYAADLGLLADEKQIAALENGLAWLTGRPAKTNETFIGALVDPIALLGIALGGRFLKQKGVIASVNEWIGQSLYQSYHMRGVENWQKCLFAAIKEVARLTFDFDLPSDQQVAGVCLALNSKHLLESENLHGENEFVSQLLQDLQSPDGTAEINSVRAAIALAALNQTFANLHSRLASIDLKNISVEGLSQPNHEGKLKMSEETKKEGGTTYNQHFYGPVASSLSGNQNTAFVNQNIGSTLPEIQRLLAQLQESVQNLAIENRTEAIQCFNELAQELHQPEPNKGTVRLLLDRVVEFTNNTGSNLAATVVAAEIVKYLGF